MLLPCDELLAGDFLVPDLSKIALARQAVGAIAGLTGFLLGNRFLRAKPKLLIRVLRIEVLEVDPMVRVERIVELVAAALGNVNADAALCDLVAELSDVEVVGQVVHVP